MKLPTTLILTCTLILVGCEDRKIEQVKWSSSERCRTLWKHDCGCVEQPDEEWEHAFRC